LRGEPKSTLTRSNFASLLLNPRDRRNEKREREDGKGRFSVDLQMLKSGIGNSWCEARFLGEKGAREKRPFLNLSRIESEVIAEKMGELGVEKNKHASD